MASKFKDCCVDYLKCGKIFEDDRFKQSLEGAEISPDDDEGQENTLELLEYIYNYPHLHLNYLNIYITTHIYT